MKKMALIKLEPEEVVIKEESEEVRIEETFRVKCEDTEEHRELKEEREEEEKHHDKREEKNSSHSKTKKTFANKRTNTSVNCTHCGRSFSRKSNLERHIRIHTGERPFSCDQCGKSFVQLSHLTVHMMIHTGEKPHCCEECGKTFPRASHLRGHLMVHAKERPHSCSECGKSFAWLSSLYAHQKTHFTLSEHKCLECEKIFTAARELKLHQGIHTGEQTYMCSHRDKRFNWSAHLKNDEKIHTGEKPHTCDQCGKSFITKCNLTEKWLKETQRRFQQKIQQKQTDLQCLREAVESHKCCAQSAVEDSEKIFTELIHSIERSRSEFTQWIRDQEKTEVRPAEERLEELEQEINDLRRRDAELEKLSHTQDHINFLQRFQFLSVLPESTNVHENPFSSLSSFDGVRESVHQLRVKLEDFCKEELKKISDRATFTNIEPKTRSDFLQYSHRFNLDLNTVNKLLHLTERNRVAYTDKVQPYPDHPDRFDDVCQVLCRESVCGRCYWEIEWSGSVCMSVSYKSISRKGRSEESVFGCNDQSWSLSCSPSRFAFVHNNTETDLSVSSISSRIGVYVDYRAGTLSFYSVSDTMSLIHTVQTTFTRPLCSGFWLGFKSSVKLCHKSE